jgi:tRNA(Ile)-lysidine synthetase-like protein
MINNLDKYRNQKWIISVSGGPDSMALLDMGFKCGLDIVVLHVNYHKRDSALRDQKIVEDYCKANHIELLLHHANELKGNFQDQARVFRYSKIKEAITQHNAIGVLVAHHKDDDLETLLFQITRKSKVSYYGLSETTYLFGIRVDRPLLAYSKEELLNYCDKSSIPYGIDESNMSSVYTRNRIRKELSTLNENEKEELFKIKKEYNSERITFMDSYRDLLNQTSLSHNDYISLSHNRHSFLLEWLKKQSDLYPISDKFIQELDRQLTESKSVKLKLTKSFRIIKQYGMISIVKEKMDYLYYLNVYECLDKEIKIVYEQREAYIKVLLPIEGFPIKITNLRACKNQLQSNSYTKLSRWFIKNKIPIQEREMWPLVFNNQNELLYILNVGYEHGVSTDTIECYMIK